MDSIEFDRKRKSLELESRNHQSPGLPQGEATKKLEPKRLRETC